MQSAPTPIVLVTVAASREGQSLIYDALQAGVLAVVNKPGAEPNDPHSVDTLIRTVKSMAQVKVIRHRVYPFELEPFTRPATQPNRFSSRAGGHRRFHRWSPNTAAGRPDPGELLGANLDRAAPDEARFKRPGLVDWLRPQCALPIQIARRRHDASGRWNLRGSVGRHLVVQHGR